jgi:hypothetical protein
VKLENENALLEHEARMSTWPELWSSAAGIDADVAASVTVTGEEVPTATDDPADTQVPVVHR